MILKRVGGAPQVPAAALVEMIRRQRGQMSTRQRVEGAHGLMVRWMYRRGGARRSRAPVAGLGLAVGIVLFGVAKFGLDRRGASALSYAIDGGRVERGGSVEAEPAHQPRLRFSDGSEVLLATGAKASLRSVDGHGAHLSLTEGRAHVDIVHLPGSRWLFDAGPFDISVTGTAFSFGWSSANDQLDVQMERGTVEVSGPLSAGPVLLRSGEHLLIRVSQRETLIQGLDVTGPSASQAAAPRPPGPEQQPSAATAPPVEPSSTARPPARASQGRATHDWAAELATGNFEAIVQQAERRGLDDCLGEADSADLAALADAARYARHDDVARRALLAERRRFPLSPAARDASFLLGRLEEAQQNDGKAMEWYDRYLTETANGTYGSEALGRKMNIAQRLFGDERARSLAEQYLSHYPLGTYAARARGLARAP